MAAKGANRSLKSFILDREITTAKPHKNLKPIQKTQLGLRMVYVTFTDEEFKAVLRRKGKKTWTEFLMSLAK